MNNINLFFIVPEARNAKIKVLAFLECNETTLPGSWTVVFLLCPHMVEGAGELYGVSLLRALIPFEGSFLMA